MLLFELLAVSSVLGTLVGLLLLVLDPDVQVEGHQRSILTVAKLTLALKHKYDVPFFYVA